MLGRLASGPGSACCQFLGRETYTGLPASVGEKVFEGMIRAKTGRSIVSRMLCGNNKKVLYTSYPPIEIIAHGDKRASRVVGQLAKQLLLPGGATIGAIVCGDALIFVNSRTAIETEDHLILFLPDKTFIEEVEKLFQVSFSFL